MLVLVALTVSITCSPDFDEASTSNKTKAGYILNLLALREGALSVSPPIPWWNFFNSMP